MQENVCIVMNNIMSENAFSEKSFSTLIIEPKHDKKQDDLCTQRRLRSAQADQSLCCLHEETLGP